MKLLMFPKVQQQCQNESQKCVNCVNISIVSTIANLDEGKCHVFLGQCDANVLFIFFSLPTNQSSFLSTKVHKTV